MVPIHSKKVLLLAIVVLIGLPGCFLKKATVKESSTTLSTNVRELEKIVLANAFEFEYLSMRGNGHFEGGGISQNLSLNMRMKRHELVWISAQAMLGIEVARALITKDSVYIIQNFPSRSYMEYSLDSLSQILSVPLTVTQLQDLFVGNPLLPYEPAQASMQNDTLVVEKMTRDFILHELFVNNHPKIARNQLNSKTGEGSAQVDYLSFGMEHNKELPLKVNIFVQRPDLTARLDLQYTNISLDPISSFPFSKPKQ
ncbi:MAG: DUF4292 domain-containing protein [Bacteroidetes bacterium]|nr:DUF4292 domain-containing protein [Bacteroidota bacterium]